MSREPNRRIAVLCGLVALLTLVTAGAGLLLRGDGAFKPVVSVRGEEYEMATSGVYSYNAVRVVAEGTGWDWFTLIFAVPALLMALPGLWKGRIRNRLFVLGLLSYLFYQYLMYAVTWALGPLFLLFIAIYALSAVGIVWIVSTISIRDLPRHFTEDFPARGVAILSFLLAGLLVVMWIPLIVSALGDGVQGVLHGQTTLVVQALDLGIVVPLALFTGVTAWKKRPVGYLLSSVVVVKGFAMAAAICAMLLAAWSYEDRFELVPFVIFASAALACFWLGLWMYRSRTRRG